MYSGLKFFLSLAFCFRAEKIWFMMTLVLDGIAPEQTLVLLKLEDGRDLHQALRALDFREVVLLIIK
ncbi:unnamed protein product, partial [Brugia timori]|uniref:SAM domain-containing protein n=1 Tax=Brugia timori TaxID=42155 RepID=A0A0R3RCK2_9BILA